MVIVVRLAVLSGLVLSVCSCQTLNRSPFDGGLSSVEKAHRAWEQLQSAPEGSATQRIALESYNEAVESLTIALQASVPNTQWNGPVVVQGRHARVVTIDSPTRAVTPPRTLSLAGYSAIRIADQVPLSGFDKVVGSGGLGVPVVLVQDEPARARRPLHPPEGDFLPATAVLEFAGRQETAGPRLKFYNPLVVHSISLGKRTFSLAANFTAPLQYSLTDSTAGQHDRERPTPSVSGEEESKLFLLNTYDPSKTPVVFIHGLRSGPVIWKNAINTLLSDPDLRQRYQPMCFVYPSGLPIPISSARLRQLLKEARGTLDSSEDDRGMEGWILVGHSMGGLVARMQVIDSGSAFWDAFFTASPNKVITEIDPATRDMVRRALWFKPLDDVKSAVFITTPHRGSELADLGVLQTLGKFFLGLPKSAQKRIVALNALPEEVIHPSLRSFNDWGNTGVENLSTKHPYFNALAQRPITVPFHSIIGIGDATDPTDASDGVVPYWSARLEGAATEVLVPYPHGCVERQGTVQELMKILRSQH